MKFNPPLKLLASLGFVVKLVGAVAIPCLTTSSTLEALVTCFVGYTVPEGFYDVGGAGGGGSYDAAQPTLNELPPWTTGVLDLLDTDNDCPSPPIDVPGLGGSYTLGRFTESAGQGSYCVLSEKNTYPGTTKVFARGWGFAIVPASAAAHTRAIHFSAPHPIFDKTTPLQAAVLFKRTGAKSLVVSGRHRKASHDVSGCAKPSAGSTATYYKTDPAHDDREPFHAALLAVRAWQDAHGGCPNNECAYLQMHRQTSCPTYDVFISSGPGNSLPSETWYTNTARPARRLKNALDTRMAVLPGTTHGLPSTADDCDLTATKNIFGRIVNGRAPPLHCTNDAELASVTGEFVHIEQQDPVVLAGYYDRWVAAVQDTFPTI